MSSISARKLRAVQTFFQQFLDHIVTTSNERMSVVIESLEILAGTADSRDVTEALTWDKRNRDTLRRLWRQYSE